MNDIEVQEVIVRAVAGANISNCLMAAIAYAATNKQVTVLVHNGRRYTIDPDALGEFVFAESTRKLEKLAGIDSDVPTK